ncbi:hypothetical protein DPMN_074682 [Dreissena polymorpha]|uniref:Uncharacterized protein n=1 Tax=Dreissena polymorpha TaxID=45954 RepID=A0A9D4BNM5_DREPO|nr:hypothetical protein DPMN_074682 [Dreissena polymorpha]
MPDWGKYIGANRLAQVNNCGTVKPPQFNRNDSPRPELSTQKQQRYVTNQCDTNPQTLSTHVDRRHLLTITTAHISDANARFPGNI